MNWFKKELEVQPYSELAYIYDDVMAHVDYKTWAEFIHDIIMSRSVPHINILDVACGTGSLLLELENFHFQLWGFDQSHAMLTIAKRKIEGRGCQIPIWQSNMTSFYVKKKFDVILCLYDSFNYLLEKRLWNNFFNAADACLNHNGLIIFDICTEKNSVKYFNNFFEKSKGKDYSYTRKSVFIKETLIHSNVFKINYDNSNIIFIERHEQRIYKIAEVIDFLSKSQFKLLNIYDDFSFRPASENSLRAHFILEKVKG